MPNIFKIISCDLNFLAKLMTLLQKNGYKVNVRGFEVKITEKERR